jgi:anhydro-N-acetylmuramic acid kinase
MRVVGLMSGTSHDAIDVAVADFTIFDETVALELRGFAEYPIPSDLDRRVAQAIRGDALDAFDLCRLDTDLGQAFADAAVATIADLAGSADLIASHGQTIYHWEEKGRTLGSLQIGNPGWIAERTGVPVVSDFRVRDIAAGGNGAPLVSIFDVMLGRGRFDLPVAFLNLGGIANMTVVGGGRDPIAYDLGPANALIDAAVVLLTDGAHKFDMDGRRARAGTSHNGLLELLLSHDYYDIPPPKTTGKETFSVPYLLGVLDEFPGVPVNDVLATLTDHVASVVADEARRQGLSQVIASGGGINNPTLIEWIVEKLGDIQYVTIDTLGVPSDAKEAYAMALLGFLTVKGMTGTVPSCTGALHPTVLGSVTPGSPDRPFPGLSPTPAVTRLEIVTGGGQYGAA